MYQSEQLFSHCGRRTLAWLGRLGAAALVIASQALAAQGAAPPLEVRDAWTRATPRAAPVAAGYLEVRNAGPADRLLGASSPYAERVELHVMAREGDVMKMREVAALDVPARGVLRLEPGGAHLMIMGPRRPFRPGARVPVTLRFERAGEVGVELEVREPGAAGHAHHHHAH